MFKEEKPQFPFLYPQNCLNLIHNSLCIVAIVFNVEEREKNSMFVGEDFAINREINENLCSHFPFSSSLTLMDVYRKYGSAPILRRINFKKRIRERNALVVKCCSVFE